VVLLEGWLEGGAQGAREQLRKFWKRVSLDGVLSPIQRSVFDRILGFWSSDGLPTHLWLEAWSHVASPYDVNPLDINPLRDALTGGLARLRGEHAPSVTAGSLWACAAAARRS
jgi:NTE family protein